MKKMFSTHLWAGSLTLGVSLCIIAGIHRTGATALDYQWAAFALVAATPGIAFRHAGMCLSGFSVGMICAVVLGSAADELFMPTFWSEAKFYNDWTLLEVYRHRGGYVAGFYGGILGAAFALRRANPVVAIVPLVSGACSVGAMSIVAALLQSVFPLERKLDVQAWDFVVLVSSVPIVGLTTWLPVDWDWKRQQGVEKSLQSVEQSFSE